MKRFWNTVITIFKTEDIRRKILFSFGIMVVFRMLASIPVVGIPTDAIVQLFSGNEFGDLLSTVSGGVLETASMVAIGLSPYINASIILQLLTTVVPKLEELKEEGSEGRRKISMYTRFLTVPLAILQSFVIFSTLKGYGLLESNLSTLNIVTMSATLTAGSLIMMWFGELTSESGVGGGSSYLIALGIISGIPGTISSNFKLMDTLQQTIFIFMTILLVVATVFITQAERRIKVQHSRRGRTGISSQNYIPVKLTQSGVMPVIFATTVISFPQLIAQFLISGNYSDKVTKISKMVIAVLSNQYVATIGLFVLIILISFLYLSVVFNTDELAENLQKQGAFIPGIRPGDTTSEYLRKTSLKLTAVGSGFLALISILPKILISLGFMSTTVISGTGMLIVVGVIVDIKREIESMMVVRTYDTKKFW
jgi:preprotein translocase subunit SecY